MAHTSRIHTPLKQHWNRFRLGALPVLSFIACVILTLFLWERQARYGSLVGEVEAAQWEVAAGADGLLVAPENKVWQLFDQVKKGEVIAYLDDKILQSELLGVEKETERLQAQLKAAETQWNLDQERLQLSHSQNETRLIWEVEQRRVAVLQQAAVVNGLDLDLKVAEANLARLEGARQRIPVNAERLEEARRVRNDLKTRRDDNFQIGTVLQKQYKDVQRQLKDFAPLDPADAETVLAPIRSAIEVQENLMQTINLRIDNMTITSPIDGFITAIYVPPGKHVRAGDSIVAVARSDATYVVSYVREQRVRLYKGMEVGLRLRAPGSQEYIGQVEDVGPKVAPVPIHQLRDQTTPEWGTPVRIRLPADMLREVELRPTQLVQVIFRNSS
jgi:HlyD family secretion protein